MSRIIVSVTSDLVTDQRVQKVCDTLHADGFDILLIGRQFSNSPSCVRPYKTYRMRLLFNKGFAFYAEFNIRLFFKLFFTEKDILLSNDLDTLIPNYLISKIFNKKLVYDSHELFTEVPELIHRPKTKNIWLKIENFIFPKLKNVYTVCGSIANYYNEKYKVKVAVIRNLPNNEKSILPASFPIDTEGKKIILYQGAVNKARGLELLIDTMSILKDWILIIVGNGDVKNKLQEKVQGLACGKRIFFMDRQLPETLAKYTLSADLGVSIEEDLGMSYHFALPNKIFDYIHAEIPILVSDLPEMKSIIDTYNVGSVLTDRTIKGLASAIQDIVKKDNKSWDFKGAIADLNWENESKKLKKIFKNIK